MPMNISLCSSWKDSLNLQNTMLPSRLVEPRQYRILSYIHFQLRSNWDALWQLQLQTAEQEVDSRYYFSNSQDLRRLYALLKQLPFQMMVIFIKISVLRWQLYKDINHNALRTYFIGPRSVNVQWAAVSMYRLLITVPPQM